MKKSCLLIAVCALFGASAVQASLIIQAVRLVIQKPDYNNDYSIGMEAYVSSDLPLLDVIVDHEPVAGPDAGTWELDKLSGTRWWNWAGHGALYTMGEIDGVFTVTASDGLSEVSASVDVPVDVELDFISGYQALETNIGYQVTANPVFSAESYFLQVWDPIDEIYVFSQRSLQSDGFDIVPYTSLLRDREYRFYLRAFNYFEGGSFSSISKLDVTYAPVPIPAAVWLFGSGLLGMIGITRRKKAA